MKFRKEARDCQADHNPEQRDPVRNSLMFPVNEALRQKRQRQHQINAPMDRRAKHGIKKNEKSPAEDLDPKILAGNWRVAMPAPALQKRKTHYRDIVSPVDRV